MGKLAVVGCGHWGGNYVRIFAGLLGAENVTAVEREAGTLRAVQRRNPGVCAATDLGDVLAAGSHSMAVIATPAATHFELVGRCLEAGLDVLAEKPLTLHVRQAAALRDLAAARHRVLMVGHTFLYNPAVRKLRDLVRRGACGNVYYMKATRTHLGLVRPDVNAVWDLAPHDVSIFDYVLGKSPEWVSASGGCYLRKGKEDVAFVTLGYPGGVLGHIHVSWADSNKERTVEIIGSRARVVFDDLNAMERVKVYRKGISANVAGGDNYGEFLYALRDGDIISPKIETAEPLAELCREFLRVVRTRRRPLASAEEGVAVVAVMAAIERSLARGGRRVTASP
jgi:predicted dehydrogenase